VNFDGFAMENRATMVGREDAYQTEDRHGDNKRNQNGATTKCRHSRRSVAEKFEHGIRPECPPTATNVIPHLRMTVEDLVGSGSGVAIGLSAPFSPAALSAPICNMRHAVNRNDSMRGQQSQMMIGAPGIRLNPHSASNHAGDLLLSLPCGAGLAMRLTAQAPTKTPPCGGVCVSIDCRVKPGNDKERGYAEIRSSLSLGSRST
jgi:hypothetical protein